jgi:L-galactono-1,4-lactone dehydrogenase
MHGCVQPLQPVFRAVPVGYTSASRALCTLQEVKQKHAKWLRDNRHLRYMWIPHTDAVVVVTNNPLAKGGKAPRNPGSYSESEKTAAFQRLLQVCRPGNRS